MITEQLKAEYVHGGGKEDRVRERWGGEVGRDGAGYGWLLQKGYYRISKS